MTSEERLTAALADRYRLERELGAGGMATVYLAEDLKHDRKVAIKVLHPELSAVIGAERFLAEIKLTAQLQHPHILGLIDSGTADGLLYYVMPFIDGESLRGRLAREKQLPVEDAVRLAREVAAALDYAHRRGIVHRDIKPENILLQDGAALVADFGIALAVQQAGGQRMTQTGLSLGTPSYMSPEQAMGEREITPRADVYALGAMTYEMLAGEPPFTGSSSQAIVARVLTEQPRSITAQRRTVPPHVEATVLRALEKLPADRWGSAKEFTDALADERTVPATVALASATAPRRPRAARALTLGLAAALAAMTAVAAWAWRRPAPAAPVSRYRLALPDDQAPFPSGNAEPSPDGSLLVYVGPGRSDRGVPRLWVKRRDLLDATPLPGTEGTTSFTISPDNASVAFVLNSTLRRTSLEGASPDLQLARNVAGRRGGLAWLDDGTIAFIAPGNGRIMRVPDQGGPSEEIWASDSLAASNLTAVPGGRGVLFATCSAPCANTNLRLLDLRTREDRVVRRDARKGYLLPTGELVVVGDDGAVTLAPVDPRTLEPTGRPRVVADSVWFDGVQPVFAVSNAGTMVMQTGEQGYVTGRYGLVWVDRAGRETVVDSSTTFLMTRFAGNYGWSISPDGRRVAIGISTDEGDDIWTKPLPRGPLSRVTFGSGSENRPRWTADGRHLTFVRFQSGSQGSDGIVLRRADGLGADSLLWKGQADEAVLAPDGTSLIIRTGAAGPLAGGRDLLLLRLGTDTAPRPLLASRFDENAIALSQDGGLLAYESDETGRTEIFVRAFPDVGRAKVQVSGLGGVSPVWSRDGRELFYLRNDSTMMAAPLRDRATLAFGDPVPLFKVPPRLMLARAFYTPWDVAPDGRFLMASSVGGSVVERRPLIIVENWFGELARRRGE
jgi:serine/threonine-protein kinase